MTTALRTLAPALMLLLAAAAPATTVDFEDVGADLPIAGNPWYDGADGAGGFDSGGVAFENVYTDFGGFAAWAGFSYSQATDTTDKDISNQYSAFPGSGAGGSATYAVGFVDFFNGVLPTLRFQGPRNVVGVEVTNTTVAGLTMLTGGSFGALPFGDDDFFRLTITGLDAQDQPTGSRDVYLADYRFADPGQDFVLDTWAPVDLTGLGAVHGLAFEVSGSQNDAFGLITPAYFALDNLVIPEPGSAGLLAMGLLALTRCRSRR